VARRASPGVGLTTPFVSRTLFVFDRENWCSVFSGPEEAAANLETADVDANEYIAFDEHGAMFTLRAAGTEVHISRTAERDEEQLHARLQRFVEERHFEVATDDPIAIANAVLRDEWSQRWPQHPRWLARRVHGVAPPTI
jgi:hypothetical protein